MASGRSKNAQDGPRTARRRPQDGSRTPWTAQAGPNTTPKTTLDGPQEASKTCPDVPKMAQDARKSLQDAPQRLPDAPRRPQNAPQRPQDASEIWNRLNMENWRNTRRAGRPQGMLEPVILTSPLSLSHVPIDPGSPIKEAQGKTFDDRCVIVTYEFSPLCDRSLGLLTGA